jgi:LysM domain
MNAALPLLPELTLAQQAIEQKAQMPLLSVQLNDDKKWFLSTGQLAELGVVRQSAGNEIKPAKLPNEDYWAVHYLDKGESLKAVAEFHGITEDLLRIANKLKRRQSISLGQRLLVPLKQIASESFNKASTSILFKGV